MLNEELLLVWRRCLSIQARMTSTVRLHVVVASVVRGLGAAVRSILPDIHVTCFDLDDKGKIPGRNLADLSECEVLFCDPPVGAQVMALENLPALKWMHLSWAGVEGIARFVRERKIQPKFIVTRTGDTFGPLIGEYVVGHVIAFERRFKETYRCQDEKVWNKDLKMFRNLPDLTIGVLGLGQIGREIARLCKAMGMTVWGLVRDPSSPPQHPHVDHYSTLPELLVNCDYICNILPSTSQTRNLLSGQVLAACKSKNLSDDSVILGQSAVRHDMQMKAAINENLVFHNIKVTMQVFGLPKDDTSGIIQILTEHTSKKTVFINVGRGDVVDEDSLVNALNEGWLGGAILDVFTQEPLPESSPLWSTPNLVITPHVSGPTFAAESAECFANNYRKYSAKEHLNYVVNWDKGY